MRSVPRALFAAILASVAMVARAADPATEPGAKPAPAPDAPPAATAPPGKTIDLDRLLHPPAASLQPSGKIYGGRDQKGWQEEFRKARAEVADLQGKIEAEQEHLRSASGGEWQYSPAGGEATDPEVLKLRATLRRDRQSLEASQQRLRDLDVEASLAGVPEDWRKP
ncbi:MAG TPA: hypothetical protein VEI82_15425 [Myxococcota bacterium]|nr:hypothetical protein [Myxococcota bacterium]